MTPTTCRGCGNGPLAPGNQRDAPLRHLGRGLCQKCHRRLYRRAARGTSDELLDYERVSRSALDVIEDWESLAAQGYTRKQAATRIGMTPAALNQAIARHRRRQREAEIAGVAA